MGVVFPSLNTIKCFTMCITAKRRCPWSEWVWSNSSLLVFSCLEPYLTVWGAQVPEADGFIQGSGYKGVIHRRHGQGHHSEESKQTKPAGLITRVPVWNIRDDIYDTHPKTFKPHPSWSYWLNVVRDVYGSSYLKRNVFLLTSYCVPGSSEYTCYHEVTDTEWCLMGKRERASHKPDGTLKDT